MYLTFPEQYLTIVKNITRAGNEVKYIFNGAPLQSLDDPSFKALGLDIEILSSKRNWIEITLLPKMKDGMSTVICEANDVSYIVFL